MTELMRRRRALMGVSGSADPNILFEWKPSDGLSPLVIYGSDGVTPTYTLTDSYLRVYAPASWKSALIKPSKTLTYPDKYKVTVQYSSVSGNNVNIGAMGRGDNMLNNYVTIGTSYYTRFVVHGAASTTAGGTAPSSGTISLIVDKTAGNIYGELNGTQYGPYSIAQDQSNADNALLVAGNSTSMYYDIDHIKIEAVE